jgi:hypothetical protein
MRFYKFVWEHERYGYPWRNTAADPQRCRRAARLETLNSKALGWADFYFNDLLFNEKLGPRRR